MSRHKKHPAKPAEEKTKAGNGNRGRKRKRMCLEDRPVLEPVHGELTGSSGYRSLVQASTVPPPPVRTDIGW